MNEFVDKLISRLENRIKYNKLCHEEFPNAKMSFTYEVQINAYKNAIEIVNQLAEEYNNESVKGDLISRNLLLKAIDKCLEDCENHMTEPSIWNVIGIIKRHPTVCNDGWIPCSERLPEDCTIYEVTARFGNGMRYIEFAYYDESKGEWWKHDDDGLVNVLAWKEHSAPYQPKGE